MKIFGYEIAKARSTEVVEKAAAKPKAPNKGLGVIGTRAGSGVIDEEFIQELKWPDAGKVYQEMAYNDAVIGGCLYLIETLIRTTKWKVVTPSGEPNEWSEFLQQCMSDMDTAWDDFIQEVLSMVTYGFSFHEIVYKVRRGPAEKQPQFKSKYSDGKIGWQKMPVRSQATLKEWTLDPVTGEAIEFVQDTSETAVVGGAGEVHIPLEGNLLFRTKATRGNPEGRSLLRTAYRSWYFKRYIEELEGIGVERDLAGIPVIQPDENTPLFDDKNPDMVELLGWAASMVDTIRQDRNHGVVLPHGWKLELLTGGGTNNSLNTDTIIHRHESRMAISMLSDLLLLGGDRTGSFALAETKQSILISSLEGILNSICSVLNATAVPRLLILNGVTDLTEMPTIGFDHIIEPTVADLALLLRAAQIDITKNKELFNFIMQAAGAPTLSEDELSLLTRMDAKPDENRVQDEVDNELK